MKKSTILVIAILIVASALVVGIYGVRGVPYDQVEYVEQIIPVSVTTTSGETQIISADPDGNLVVFLDYEENLELLITYKLVPEDATIKDVKMEIFYPYDDLPAHIERNSIVFERKEIIGVRYSAQDSPTAAEAKFYIMFND